MLCLYRTACQSEKDWHTQFFPTMADVFLIVATTVTFLILLVVAIYLLVYYQHPDDHNDAYFPKLVVIIGIMLAGATCLLLPLDVANNEGYAGTDFIFCVEISTDSTRLVIQN